MDYSKIIATVNEYKDEIVKIRRDFHTYAEPAWREFRTSAKIAKMLDENGIKFFMGPDAINTEFVMGYPEDPDFIKGEMARAVEQGADEKYVEMTKGYTGVVAVIETGRPGPVTTLRFDIDSNDVDECMDEDHAPHLGGYRSKNPQCMHACGHDGHASIGLVTAISLNKIKDDLCGTIRLCFQPAEEGVRGALSMVKKGWFDDADYFICGHLGRAENIGDISLRGSSYLATSKFNAYIYGKPTHAGGSPQLGNNALLAACAAATNAYAFTQDGRGAGRVNVGRLVAGTGRNVVPEKAELWFETRGATTEIEEEIYMKVTRAVKAAADMYGCTCEFKKMGGAQGANSDMDFGMQLGEIMKEALDVELKLPKAGGGGGSEDATYMMRATQQRGGKAVYFGLGTHTKGSAHNGHYDIDDSGLIHAARIFSVCVSNLNNVNK